MPPDRSSKEYDALKAQNILLQRKLGALSYLPQAIAQKEYEARQNQEKATNYEASNLRLHRQLAEVIRSSISTGETTGDVTCPKCGHRQHHAKTATTTTPQQSLKFKLTSRAVSPVADTSPVTDWPTHLTEADRSKLHVDGAPAARPRVPAGQTSTIKSSTKQPAKHAPAELLSGLFKVPEVSKEQFDRIVTEHAKLKQAMYKLEKEKNFDMHQFMSCQEYERVIAGLREDLRHAEYRAEELQQLLNLLGQKSKDAMLQKNLQLQVKNTSLTREVVTKQTMADAYLEAYRKVKAEHDNLLTMAKAETSTAQQRSSPTETQESSVDKSHDVDHFKRQILQLQSQLSESAQSHDQESRSLKLTVEDLNVQLKRSESERESLKSKCQSLSEVLHSQVLDRPPTLADVPESMSEVLRANAQLEQDRDVLRSDLRAALEQKQILTIQLQTFEEDFKVFQREDRQKNVKIDELQKEIYQLKQQVPMTMGAPTVGHRVPLRRTPKHDEGFSSRDSSGFQSRDSSGYPSRDSGLFVSQGSHLTYRTDDSGFGSTGSRSESSRGSSGYISPGLELTPARTFVCERCEEEFKLFEEEKFKEHTRKCVV